jgi:hypothetical protein
MATRAPNAANAPNAPGGPTGPGAPDPANPPPPSYAVILAGKRYRVAGAVLLAYTEAAEEPQSRPSSYLYRTQRDNYFHVHRTPNGTYEAGALLPPQALNAYLQHLVTMLPEQAAFPGLVIEEG